MKILILILAAAASTVLLAENDENTGNTVKLLACENVNRLLVGVNFCDVQNATSGNITWSPVLVRRLL